MKINCFLLLAISFCHFTQARSNTKIELNFDKALLGEVFEAIESQTDYEFAYGGKVPEISVRNIHFVHEDIEAVLSFIGEKASLDFSIVDRTIAVSERDGPFKETRRPTGAIRGRVYDSDNRAEPLSGATIFIRELDLGAAADIDGFFRLEGVPEGEHILEVSYLGYATRRVTIQVIENNILQLNIGLEQTNSELDEVVVSASIMVEYAPVDNSTEESLVSVIKTSPVVLTGISNEQIARSFDIDAAEVVRRVPGISLIDNHVVLRGMDPRYNMTMINGMIAPSSEMDTRAFTFNLLPSSVIDQMVVHKSPSPELPGNFGGGVIKIKTKSTAVARRVEVGYLQQYRTFGSSLSEFYTYKGSDRDWYGGGVADRELPDILRDPNYNIPQISDFPQEVARVGEQLPAVRTPQRDHHGLDSRAFVNYYDSWKLGNMRLNNLSYANYELQRQFVETDLNFNNGSFARLSDGEIINFSNGDYIDSTYTEQIRLSAMQNLSLIINKDHRIDLNTLATRNATDRLVNREGVDEENFETKTLSYRYNVRDLVQAKLSGDHRMGSHHLYWSAGINLTYENMPDQQRYEFIAANNAEGLWQPEFNTGGNNFNTRISFDTDEEAQIYQLDYTKDFARDIKLKAGGYLEQRDRSFDSHVVVIEADGTGQIQNTPTPAPWENVIDTLYTQFRPGRLTLTRPTASAFPGRYRFDDEIRAGYAAVTLPMFDGKLNIHAGARFEWNERFLFDENGDRLDSIPVGSPQEPAFEKIPNQLQDFLLPSINVAYNLSDRTLVRAAYGRTIDRPQYREQSDFQFFDFEEGFNVGGQPLLRIAEIDNYDLRWEHYPSPSEFLALGGFYKRLTNAIEMYDNSRGGWALPLMRPQNTALAEVYGLEVELRKKLGFMGSLFKDVSLIANGALIKSEVTAVEGVDGRPLTGTSPYLVNLGLYYGQQDSPTKFSAMYNVAGDRLRIAEGTNNSDVGALYERRRHLIDITFSQQLTEQLQLRAGVQNLLNAPFQFYRDGNQNEKFDPGTGNAIERNPGSFRGDYVEREFREGSYISLGLYFTF